MGKTARRRRRPAAGLGPLGREVLDAGDDGHRPEPRASTTTSRQGPGRADRRRLRFACDAYRRLHPDVRQDRAGRARRARSSTRSTRPRSAKGEGAQDTDLDADDLRALDRRRSRRSTEEHTGSRRSRRTRASSCDLAIEASSSRGTPSARATTAARSKIPDDLGTAVNVVAMVFGNRGDGLRHRRRVHPRPGDRRAGPYGDYLPNAQGEDVVAGIRNTLPLAELEEHRPGLLRRAARRSCTRSRGTTATCATSSSPSRGQAVDAADAGRQAHRLRRVGRWPTSMLDEGLIDEDEALLRVDANRAGGADSPRFDPAGEAARRSRRG